MIVVLGGTGFVGGHLLDRLVEGDEPIRCAVRTSMQERVLARLGFETMWADVRDVDSLTTLFSGARVVVNLVTATRETRSAPFRVVHGEGMLNLVRAATRARVDRVVHVGALGPESERDRARHAYLHWKQEATRILQLSGLGYVTLETSIVFGPGDQHLTHVALALKWMPFFPLAGGDVAANTELQPLWVGDLVQALLVSMDNSFPAGQTLPLGGPRVWRFGEIVRLVQELLGTRKHVVSVPGWLMHLYFSSGRFSPVSAPMVELLRGGIPSVADSADSYRRLALQPAGLEDRIDYLCRVGVKELMAWRRRRPLHGVFGRQNGQIARTQRG